MGGVDCVIASRRSRSLARIAATNGAQLLRPLCSLPCRGAVGCSSVCIGMAMCVAGSPLARGAAVASGLQCSNQSHAPPTMRTLGCAGGDCARLRCGDHPVPEDVGEPAHGHRLHRAVRAGAHAPSTLADAARIAEHAAARDRSCRHRSHSSPPADAPKPPSMCPKPHAALMPPCRPPPQLANVLTVESLFYTCIIPFIIFFGAFAFVIYPLRDVIHPTGGSLLRRRVHAGVLEGMVVLGVGCARRRGPSPPPNAGEMKADHGQLGIS